MVTTQAIDRAAEAIAGAGALLVTAGAGMGVDSGLPDFRGDQGFWRAYPPYAALGLSFVDLANPAWFAEDVGLAWGFYGHRLNLYRATTPHDGFGRLAAWGRRLPLGAFVFTSNVDGQFQRAGFAPERILECHGAIEVLQCLAGCGAPLFPAGPEPIEVDPATFRAAPPFPRCPGCGRLARPNVLMFGDAGWDETRTAAQQGRLAAWLDQVAGTSLVIVECGAGSAVPTVRRTGERIARARGATLIRINTREPEGGTICLPLGAAEALAAIDTALGALGVE